MRMFLRKLVLVASLASAISLSLFQNESQASLEGVHKCGHSCPRMLNLVCGSDGKVHIFKKTNCLMKSNECHMRKAACKTNTTITQMDKDFCEKKMSPCDGIKCLVWAVCVDNDNGQVSCECPALVPELHEPVCGTDHLDYENHFAIKRRSCELRMDIKVLYSGKCKQTDESRRDATIRV